MTSIQHPKFKISNGFTLIEVLVAIFILSIGVLSVFGIFPLGIQIIGSSKMASVAVYLGEAKIEETIFIPYEQISIGTTTESVLPSPFSAYRRETEATCFDPNDLGSFPDCPGDTGIKKIKVTVFWKSPVGLAEKSIELVTLISEK